MSANANAAARRPVTRPSRSARRRRRSRAMQSGVYLASALLALPVMATLLGAWALLA